MSEKPKIKDSSHIKSLGFNSFAIAASSSSIDVKDGKIVRTRPFDYDQAYEPEQRNPWKIEARGKVYEAEHRTLLSPFSVAYKKRAYSPNRIPYPLKRVDWDPQGERNPQNRGKSKFERISWDEATTIIADELVRMKETYGPAAVLVQGDGHGETKLIHGPHGCQSRLLQLFGGYTLQVRQPDSWEGWCWGSKHVWAQNPVGQMRQTNMLKDMFEYTDLMLCWGCDQETTPWGWGGQYSAKVARHFRDLGVHVIFICPDLNYAAAIHADKWIPVLPNTDAALQLAIAYTWIVEDTFDKDYLDTHAVGFEQFKDYVIGLEDGVPKTPKWAEERCGVPARVIKALAREWSKKATIISHCNGGGLIRSAYSHEPGRLEVLLLAMQGLGKHGSGQFIYFQWQIFGIEHTNPGPRSACIPTGDACYTGLDFGYLPPQFIPKTLIPKAILNKEGIDWKGVTYCYMPAEDQYNDFHFPLEGYPRIHMIWTDTPCWTTCWNGGNEYIEAMRDDEIETIVAQHPWFENDCLFADIILPSNTKFEEEDFDVDLQSGFYNHIVYETQCIEPVGESKSDFECVLEVAKKLGLADQLMKGCQNYEEMIKLGFDNSGCQNMVSWEEFRDKKYYMVPTAEDWEDDEPGLHAFYRDPEGNPLETPSGKIEFYSEKMAALFPGDTERPPTPHFVPFGETHQESQLHPRSEKYPFLCVSNHPRWRVHANLDDISWLREIQTCKVVNDGYAYEPVWINPKDAERLGIKHGDVVQISNERGIVLGGAYVTERLMPGCVYQDHGARLDPIDPGYIDRGGANNLICPTAVTSKNCAGEVTNGFLVNCEKADVEALKRQYPEAFEREYDPATGFNLTSWIVGEE